MKLSLPNFMSVNPLTWLQGCTARATKGYDSALLKIYVDCHDVCSLTYNYF